MTLHLGSVIVGVLLAFGVSMGFVVLLFALVAWRDRKEQKAAIHDLQHPKPFIRDLSGGAP